MKSKVLVAILLIVLLASFVTPVSAAIPQPGEIVENTGRLMTAPYFWTGPNGMPFAFLTIGIIEGVPEGGSVNPVWLTIGVFCRGDLAVRARDSFHTGDTVWVRGTALSVNAYPNQYTLKAWNAKVIHD